MSFEVTGDVRSLWQCLFNSTYAPIARAQYDIDGSGPLGVPNGVAFATTRVPDSVFEAVNDTFHPSLPADRGHLIFQYSSSPLLPDYAGNVTMVSPFVSLVQPELPGHMELTSADYRDQPKIFTNYFASPGRFNGSCHGTVGSWMLTAALYLHRGQSRYYLRLQGAPQSG
jgi:hypothetical protein